MSSMTDRAVDVAQNVAKTVEPYVPTIAKDAATYAVSTASSAATLATSTATSAYNFATGTASSAYCYASQTVKVVVTGATTTITTYTPGPVLNAVTSAIDGAKAISQDPVGSVKSHVPVMVIHAGEKTYEIIHPTFDRAAQSVTAATGFVVTKVNGTVEYITAVPAVHSLIEQINKLTAPVLSRFGVNKGENGEVEAEGIVGEVPVVSAAPEIPEPVTKGY
ncbi:expressed protein [Batrachochytrium dendrobatidis JAM81]|uniref:Expressed protein n=2 Tax=Batrachochytrium dendrobatidis TaxID=109871 RepID=F4P8K2_BATDJ|nr:uncharacterized protein BATDEDRAFT_37252 [Batrachochytrium dendrobatidis JAM81]KAJ8324023.1 hypothetical protein O5D80_007244 [Batrachochytrium dendrobatidis]OAJ43593.1 hypothetical protein BDEG_26938 [Batrachochytrium dendrobatidis JEL423]EGF78504.1 expressed protein [Batrachochytrium dendrobatidis JAM81]KAJ8324024.1 hypothetical protein O5D80_007244 [Batrachochytrium dendrobatidis]KAK5664826.1 hypothetical protein QVD99_008370 [Batrachochytrium dendrobatidis]|eukprot:XP_006680812.1 expressed protein [Batrachochytrium dendrobatidis JAM81]